MPLFDLYYCFTVLVSLSTCLWVFLYVGYCAASKKKSTLILLSLLAYEIQRQADVLSKGVQINFETRMFVWQEGVTKPLRTKESDKDYRYEYPVFFEIIRIII